MDLTHIHLMLNHVPLIGVVFGLVLGAIGLIRKSRELKIVSLSVFVLTGLIAVAVYLTGEPAEKSVESMVGVSKTIIEQHEEAALVALMGSIGLAIISLGGLFFLRRSGGLARWFVTSAVIISFAVSGLMAWTANLGGQVRHSEIRSAKAASDGPQRDSQVKPQPREEREHTESER